MKTPFVAKKNFAVYNVLAKRGDDEYVTPFQRCQVSLNSALRSDTEFPENVGMDTDRLYANIADDAIHAYIDYIGCNDDVRLFKAIVRKGTRFYVSTDSTEIAAESLYITDEEITESNPCTEEFNETYEYIMSEFREAAEQHNGVRVGDIMLSDNTFVHVEDYKYNGAKPAIGVVGYFIDNNPVAVGLKIERLQWRKYEGGIKAINVVNTEKEAYADYNGREYTDKLYKIHKNRLDDFPVLEYCVEYETEGTKKGDWYLPSSGEVANIARNMVIINDSLKRISGAELFGTCNQLWCSAEYSTYDAWYCYMNHSYLGYWGDKWYWANVRPALALHLTV